MLFNAIRGYNDAQTEKYRLEHKLEKENTRWMLWHLYNMMADKDNRLSTPRDFVSFSWEDEETKALTPEQKAVEHAELKRRIAERYN